jgi:(p)ppGpp synthase/HD superfamily hydrolase
VDDAIALARRAHQGQLDKAGRPYIEHILRVVSWLTTDDEKVVGALHDVVENSDLTLEDLRRLGFSAEIVRAVDCLTHRPTESYLEYVHRLRPNALARRVKLADLRDNMDMSRLAVPTARDWSRLSKYREALTQLQDLPV